MAEKSFLDRLREYLKQKASSIGLADKCEVEIIKKGESKEDEKAQ